MKASVRADCTGGHSEAAERQATARGRLVENLDKGGVLHGGQAGFRLKSSAGIRVTSVVKF